MRRRGLLTASLLLAALLALPAVPAAAAPQAPVAPRAPGPTSPVEEFTSCLNSTRTGDVLLLVDESTSLRTSDPGAARVTAARYLLSRLSGVADSTGFRLDASVAGFADTYAPALGWTPLDSGSLPRVTAAVDAFAGRTGGFETDYWTALEGARRSLGDQSARTPGQRRCQAVAWFSDGRLDLSARTTDDERSAYGETKPYGGDAPLTDDAAADRAEGTARSALCDPRAGLADQLRAAGVVLFGIGLDARARPGDFDLMASVATGGAPVGPGPTCGRPADRPRGDFRLASDLDDLLLAFDALVPPGPPLPQTRPVCGTVPCAEGRHAFVLDAAVRRVEILGTVDRPGVSAVLLPPVGPPIPVGTDPAPRTETRPGATVTSARPAERTVSVELTSPDRGPGWAGEWALVFVDPNSPAATGESRTQIRIAGDLLPAWPARPPVLHAGERVPARFVLATGDGREVPAATLPGEALLSATLVVPGLPPRPVASLDKTAIGREATLDLTGIPAGPATLRLTLDQRTAPTVRPDGTPVAGTAMVPQSVEVGVPVTAPVGYPGVAGSVSFGTSDGGTELVAPLAATGPGCVWVVPQGDPPLAAAPADAGRVTVAGTEARSPETCRALGPGEEGEVGLTLSTEGVGNGTVTGSFTVMVAPEGPEGAAGAAQPVTVELDADLRRPLDPVDFTAALVAAVVLGLLVPIALLLLAKYVTARVPGRPLAAARVPIVVTPDRRVLRDGHPLDVDARELVDLVPLPPRGARSLVVRGVRMRVRWTALLRAPYVIAGIEANGQVRSASDHRPSREGDHAVLPLAVHNHWVVLHDRLGPPERAELLLLMSAGPDTPPELRRRLLDDAASRIPDALDALRDPGRGPHGGPPGSPPPPGPDGPFGGPPPGPPGPGSGSPFDFTPGPPRGPSPTPTSGGPW